jgi:hypothetical protein
MLHSQILAAKILKIFLKIALLEGRGSRYKAEIGPADFKCIAKPKKQGWALTCSLGIVVD